METYTGIGTLSPIAAWGIPALLVLLVIVFGILAPMTFVRGATGAGPLKAIARMRAKSVISGR